MAGKFYRSYPKESKSSLYLRQINDQIWIL